MNKTKTKKSPTKNTPNTKGGNNPKKPGTDPDQTPTRETRKPPVANPNKNTR